MPVAAPPAGEGSTAPSPPEPSGIDSLARLWKRTKEHRVLQWGLAYLAAALALGHGQELMAHAFGWGETVARIVMALLVLGLPIALALAWYHGHRGARHVSGAEATIIAMLLLIGAGLLVVFVRSGEEAAEHAAAPLTLPSPQGERVAQGAPARLEPGEGIATSTTASEAPALATEAGVSLAVLPFADMSPEGNQEYFSDGLAEELLNQLAQIKGLRVAGRTSSFSFKGKNEDLRVIAEKLGVNHLLEGSVRKAGTQLRITAQLINAADGSHLWSQSYDRKLDDVFKVQEDIAKDVAAALSITLGVGEKVRAPGGTTNLEAYDKYLRAQALTRNVASLADLPRAVKLYNEALALDPDFAPARGGLAATYVLMLTFLPETSAQTLKEMDETVRQALARAPDHWASHLANGALLMQRHDWLAADAALAKAHALAPASESTVSAIAAQFLSGVGRSAEAVRVLEAARSADPLSPWLTVLLQEDLDIAGRASEAQAEYERTKDLPGGREVPEHQALIRIWDSGDAGAIKAQSRRFLDSQAVPMPVLNKVYEAFDSPQAALGLIRGAVKDPAYQDSTRMMLLGLYAAHFGDTALALAASRRAYVDMTGNVPLTLWYPAMSEARKTEGFKQLVRDLGLYDYWRSTGKWGDFCHPLGTSDFECR